ncbi:hypothetical protein D3C80_1452580 [compost metagenome]
MKQRNDRTRRSQDITKPHHREPRFVHARNFARITEQHWSQLTTQRLQRQLGKAFGATHDIGRSHGLVRRNQDEVGHSCLKGGLGRIKRAYHIIEHTFGDVVFDHGDMLVGGGVIHRVYSPGFHDIQQLVLIANRPENRQKADGQRLSSDSLLQLGQDGIKIEFTVFKQ